MGKGGEMGEIMGVQVEERRMGGGGGMRERLGGPGGDSVARTQWVLEALR